MKQYTPIFLILVVLSSCDCLQQAKGVVLDSQTKKPVSNVALGKYEKEDKQNPSSRRIFTDESGQFDYQSISGGACNCPDLVLYFNKPGYMTGKVHLESFSSNDTILLDKLPFNRDSSIRITLSEFNRKIDDCIRLLNNKALKDISDEQHIEIMKCLNTIFMGRFTGGHFDQLKQLSEQKKYTTDITTIYPNWVPNRGMGFYFPGLNMELYGTPSLYAIYTVLQ